MCAAWLHHPIREPVQQVMLPSNCTAGTPSRTGLPTCVACSARVKSAATACRSVPSRSISLSAVNLSLFRPAEGVAH